MAEDQGHIEAEVSAEIDEPVPPSHPSRQGDERRRLPDLEAAVEIAELLEVALHTILYMRQVYPIDLFERRVKFGIPVFQCIDPSIGEYISEAVKAIGEEISESNVARVIITIHHSETPLEKFIFSFETMDNNKAKTAGADIGPQEFVQRQARGMLLKLIAIDAILLPLIDRDDMSFSVIMQLRGEDAFRVTEDDLEFDVPREGEDKGGSVPAQGTFRIRDPALVHIVRVGRLSVYLHVQEAEAKEPGVVTKAQKNDFDV